MLLIFLFASVILVAMGVFGFFKERRLRGAAGIRRFLIMYACMWLFMADILFSLLHPHLAWPKFAGTAIVLLNVIYQALHQRRERARSLAVGQVDT